MKKVLCAVHDPGGTKALAPVIASLVADPDVECRVYAGRYAEPWLSECGIEVLTLPTQLEASQCSAMVQEYNPHIIFTGTSWGSNAEQMIRNEAQSRGIPSVVVIDFWMNYAKRFLHATYPITQASDWLCVADDEMAKEVSAEGFPERRIVVTGHPHLDFLEQNRKKFCDRVSGLAGSANSIFLSEDYPESYLRSLGKHPVQIFAEAFSQWAEERNIDTARFHVKLHPKETSNRFLDDALLAISALPRVAFELVPQDAVLLNILPRYQFAFGFQSMALFEAKAFGLHTLAVPLLKGERYPSLFKAMELCGIRFVRLHPREVLNSLRQIAEISSEADTEQVPFRGAIGRVRDIVIRAGL